MRHLCVHLNSRENRRQVNPRKQGVKRRKSSFTDLLTAELDSNPIIPVS